MGASLPDLRAVLLDIDGVLTISWEPIPGAVEAVATMRAAGLTLRFVTNTTSRPRAAVADALRSAGFEVVDDDVLTAARATASYIERHHVNEACLVINSGDADEDLTGLVRTTDPRRAGVVVLGGAGPEFSYDALNAAFAAVLEGAALVAMHRNLHWRTAEGDRLDTGAYLAGLEAATHTTAVVVGKPAADFFAEATLSAGAGADETAMVGDDVISDVLGAQAAGIGGVLVRTGKYREAEVAAVAAEMGPPDHVIDSVAQLPLLLGLTGDPN